MPADLLADCACCVRTGQCTWDEVVQTIASRPGGLCDTLGINPEGLNAATLAFILRSARFAPEARQ